MTPNPTRRHLLKTGAAIGASTFAVGAIGTTAANPGKGDEKGKGTSFGRVYADDVLWRTKVATVLDERPDPEDRIYFLHDGEKPIVANEDASDAQLSPFVSESSPGERDWNGGQWTHFSAEVDDIGAFNRDAPFTNDVAVLDADYIEVELGRPGFGPPDYFVCPLNGRA